MNNKLVVITPEQAALTAWNNALDLLVAAGKLSATSVSTYKRGMDKFITWVQSNQINQITGKTTDEWIATMRANGTRPTSINTWLSGIRKFFAWASKEGIIESNPVANVTGVKRNGVGKKHLRDKLTDLEVIRVLAQPDQTTKSGKRDYAWLCLMAYSALRSVEINRANLEDLSTSDMMTLRVQGKGSTEKDDIAVLYHLKEQEAIYNWLAVRGKKPGPLFISLSNRNNGQSLGLSTMRRLGERYFKSAGIIDSRKTLHSLRHSAITKVAKHDVLKAKQIARHSNINSTLIYVHESDRLDNPGEQWIDYVNGEA